MRDALKVYLPLIALLLAAGLALWQWMEPPPPSDLIIAAGPEDGAYSAFAKRYQAILAEGGLTLEVLHTSGSAENQQLLTEGKAGAAFIQGGTVPRNPETGATPEGIQSLASIAFEPLWVFVRGVRSPQRLSQLAGKRLAVDDESSGTHTLAVTLLAASGIGASNARLLPMAGSDAAAALLAGRIDAVFAVGTTIPRALQPLVEAPDVHLMNFVQADAYHHRFPFLSSVVLPRGGLDLARDIPSRPITLLAPVTQLVARDDINPALADAVLDAARRVHRTGSVFDRPETFPSRDFAELPLNAEAERYFRSGPSLARRYLPFWAASVVERALILVLPLITLAIPLIKFAPSIYRWQVSRRILKWYRHLRDIEIEARSELTHERRAVLIDRLDAIARQVADTVVPSGYSQSLYDLREHIEFVRRCVNDGSGHAVGAAEPVVKAAATG
ncbi:MAG: TAXI family TRAP transporter solute-binding subunit [Gemmatimonas sp.]